MAGSVTEPISKAAERAQRMLFGPFNLGKWLSLGFIAFLAQLGEGGGYSARLPNFRGTFPPSGGPGYGGLSHEFDEALSWARAHQTLVLAIGTGVVVAGVLLGTLIVWLSSRGKLMFVESVLFDRHAVSEPWSRLRERAFSLFKFRMVLGLLGMTLMLPILAAALFVALPDIRAWRFESHAWLGILILFCNFLFLGLPLTIISLLLEDFVVPIMYLRDLATTGAWKVLRAEILPGNAGTIVLFYLMQFLLGLAIGLLVLFITCLTCCLAALPYLSSVLLLPIHVFRRGYSLYFLEELGQRVFPDLRPPPTWNEGRFG
ncbi:MAG TPA: hypothetical protein VGP93_04465 [Polyangiaceae bacterium]|nr:hypothetical protein [Polyangiaceae bacterium]